MNGKEQSKEKIIEFIYSDEKAVLITGTHQYNKHKLVMGILNKYYENAKILFRVNDMSNLTNEDFIGFAGLKKTPKSGEQLKIGRNYYIFDSINRGTWNRSGHKFDFAILYPTDSAIRSNITDILDNLTVRNIMGKSSWFHGQIEKNMIIRNCRIIIISILFMMRRKKILNIIKE